MPRITPAVVAEFIDASFPDLRQRGAIGNLDSGSLQTLGTLVAMLDRIDEGILGVLTSEQYRDLIVAIEYIRTTITRWQSPRESGRGPYTVGSFQPLGNRHAVVVLRDIMRAAPQEPTAMVEPRLVFLNDPDLQTSIATDISSAQAAFADGRYKNCCVMAGAGVEALLLWAVQRTPSVDRNAAFDAVQARRARENRGRMPNDRDPLRWALEQYIEVARELQLISPMTATAALLAKNFRNLIHPGRAERLQETATHGAASQALAALALTCDDLRALGHARQL
jgi:hypothetical protein